MSRQNDQTHAKITNHSDDGFQSIIEGTPDDKKFSDIMEFPPRIDEDDDYLLMNGLDIVDDFEGLLDINPSSAFEDTGEANVDDSLTEPASSYKRHSERASSPPPKKIKAMHTAYASPSSVMCIASIPPLSSMPNLAYENGDLQDKYKHALQHLALSMRRSEMTRNEIIRQRKEAETRAKFEAAQHRTVSNAENFLIGNSATLTAGLDQSRRMLKSLLAQATTQPF